MQEPWKPTTTLPPEHEEVLCYIQFGTFLPYYSVLARVHDHLWQGERITYDTTDILGWMPIPPFQ